MDFPLKVKANLPCPYALCLHTAAALMGGGDRSTFYQAACACLEFRPVIIIYASPINFTPHPPDLFLPRHCTGKLRATSVKCGLEI